MKRTGYLFLLLTIGCLFPLAPAGALDTDLEISVGYDDNPAEVDDMDGSGFARYRAQLTQSFFKETEAPDVDIFIDAAYEQYFDLENNYQLRAGASLDIPSGSDRFFPGLFAEAAAYRDDLVADDERDELILGGFVQWLVDARLTLTLRQAFAWSDYRNRVSLPGQRAHFVDRGKGKGPGGRQPLPVDDLITYARDDDIWSTEASATYYFTADIQADFSIQYRDVASSDEFESFQEYGGSARIGWFNPKVAEIFLTGFWSKLDYEDAPQDIGREDDFYGFGIGANRQVGMITLYVRLDRTVNDSPVEGENYKKVVAECGLVYSF